MNDGPIKPVSFVHGKYIIGSLVTVKCLGEKKI